MNSAAVHMCGKPTAQQRMHTKFTQCRFAANFAVINAGGGHSPSTFSTEAELTGKSAYEQAALPVNTLAGIQGRELGPVSS